MARQAMAERAAADRTWTFGHVIVDEAQEISEMAWRLLARRCPARSTIVGDIAQTGGPAGTTSWERVLQPLAGDRWRLARLTVNYRTPAEVMAATADLLAAIDPGQQPPQSVRETGVPPWRLATTRDALLVTLAEVTAQEAASAGRLAVIVPDARARELGEAVSRVVPGVSFGEIVLLGARQAKGLEFDSVLIADRAAIITGSPQGRNDLYVAMTRSTQRLGVLHAGPPPAEIAALRPRRPRRPGPAEGSGSGPGRGPAGGELAGGSAREPERPPARPVRLDLSPGARATIGVPGTVPGCDVGRERGGRAMAWMTIGEFASRARLSPKALRIYADLGLVVPAEVDPASGYRRYDESQLERARLVALLRRLDMPLADIADVIDRAPVEAAGLLARWWEQAESALADRRALVAYIQSRLAGEGKPVMKDITVRAVPERKIASITRHITSGEADAFFATAFPRLRAVAPGLPGIEGVPFVVYYGEVSQDSDGPVELSRPVAPQTPTGTVASSADIQVRLEPAHDEAYVRLSQAEMRWPRMLPFADALERWVLDNDRRPSAPLRQVLFADLRTAQPGALVCDLSVPLQVARQVPAR